MAHHTTNALMPIRVLYVRRHAADLSTYKKTSSRLHSRGCYGEGTRPAEAVPGGEPE